MLTREKGSVQARQPFCLTEAEAFLVALYVVIPPDKVRNFIRS
jgi:hypothetical protein